MCYFTNIQRQVFFLFFFFTINKIFNIHAIKTWEYIGIRLFSLYCMSTSAGITVIFQDSQLYSHWEVIQLHVILYICQLNHIYNCIIQHLETLCRFMTLPRELWIQKTMNELLGEKYIAFIYDSYNLAAILFILCAEQLKGAASYLQSETQTIKQCF